MIWGAAMPRPFHISDKFPQDLFPVPILLHYCTVIFSTLQNACFVTQSGSSKVLCAVMVP